jgi:uncharacterized protein YeeX (DUF496 family)
MKESKIKELLFDFFIFLCYNIYRKRDNNMDKIREVELLHAIKDYIHTDIDLEELRETYDLTEAEYWWIIDELKERGKL